MVLNGLKTRLLLAGEQARVSKIDKLHKQIMKSNPGYEEWRIHPSVILPAQRAMDEITKTALKNRSVVVWNRALKSLKKVSREFRSPDVRRIASEYHSSLNLKYKTMFGKEKSFKGVFKN